VYEFQSFAAVLVPSSGPSTWSSALPTAGPPAVYQTLHGVEPSGSQSVGPSGSLTLVPSAGPSTLSRSEPSSSPSSRPSASPNSSPTGAAPLSRAWSRPWKVKRPSKAPSSSPRASGAPSMGPSASPSRGLKLHSGRVRPRALHGAVPTPARNQAAHLMLLRDQCLAVNRVQCHPLALVAHPAECHMHLPFFAKFVLVRALLESSALAPHQAAVPNWIADFAPERRSKLFAKLCPKCFT
jgi:hypothetical protein